MFCKEMWDQYNLFWQLTGLFASQVSPDLVFWENEKEKFQISKYKNICFDLWKTEREKTRALQTKVAKRVHPACKFTVKSDGLMAKVT